MTFTEAISDKILILTIKLTIKIMTIPIELTIDNLFLTYLHCNAHNNKKLFKIYTPISINIDFTYHFLDLFFCWVSSCY